MILVPRCTLFSKPTYSQLLCKSTRLDARGSKSERKTEDNWRSTVEKERDRAGWMSWSMARMAAQNRVGWKDNRAIYTFWCEER